MKFIKFAGIAALAMMVLAGCSKETQNGGTVTEDQKDGSFLSINIVSTPEAGTRAGGNQETGEPGNATYEEGTTTENAVEKVRFFFYKDGKAVACVYGERNWVDYVPTAATVAETEKPNVEKAFSAAVVLKKEAATATAGITPDEVIVIANPAKVKLPADSNPMVEKDALRAIVENYVEKVGTNGFVMANSVYQGKTTGEKPENEEVFTTKIGKDCIQLTRALAEEHPVTIYIERCVAKVRLKYNETSVAFDDANKTYIVLKDKDGNVLKVGDAQVYAQVTGWALTAETEKGYLSKRINKDWADDLFHDDITLTVPIPWTYAPYNRSYWAINPANAGQAYYKYTSIGTRGIAAANEVYTNENAADVAETGMQRTWPTQAIIAATLVGKNRQALTICEYAGEKFLATKTDAQGKFTFEEIKTQMVNLSTIYRKKVEGQTTTFTKITPDDVVIKTLLENYDQTKKSDVETQDYNGRYYVELAMPDDIYKTSTWTLSTDKDAPAANPAQIKKALQDVGHAKIWNSGKTYWFFPIEHLGYDMKEKTEEGEIDVEGVGEHGVVRNHIYDCTIDAIGGFGTPIYNPDETVWPEKPKDDDAFISAQVKILSWRVVTSSVELVW